MPIVETPATLPASLFMPKKGYTVEPLEEGAPISFDLIIKEKHSIENEVSNQPIEKGSDLSYHIKKKLQTGSLTGVISNWSINGESFLTDYISSVATTKELRYNRAKVIWDMLSAFAETAERLKIVTALNVYDDVIITSVEAERDSESGEAQEIKMSFQQLNVVTLRRELADATVRLNEYQLKTATPSATSNKSKQSAPKKSAGKTPTQSAYNVGGTRYTVSKQVPISD